MGFITSTANVVSIKSNDGSNCFEISKPGKPQITLREFKMWLEGLLSGNDDKRSLPSLDQWRSVLAMIERIEDPGHKVENHYHNTVYPTPTPTTINPYPYVQPSILPNPVHPWGLWGSTSTINTTGTGTFTMQNGTGVGGTRASGALTYQPGQ